MYEMAKRVLAAYDATDRHISDSDLDNEQSITVQVRMTLGDIRKLRRSLAGIERGRIGVDADLAARRAYDDTL